MYTLYYSPFACSIVPHIVLNRIGVEFTLEKIDIQTQQQFEGTYRQINPHAQVPALQTEDGTLGQVGAIILYLAEQHPEARLLPKSSFQRAEVIKWLFYFSSSVHKVFNTAFYPERVTEGRAQDVFKQCLSNVDQILDEFEDLLQKQNYVCGSEPQLPDYYLFAVLNWIRALDKNLDTYPALSAFKARLMAMPEVQQAMLVEFREYKVAS